MNRKGFTLIEVLATLMIMGVILVLITYTVKDTFSSTKEESYKLMKNSIIKSAKNYVLECNSGISKCNFSYGVEFDSEELLNGGYVRSLNSPIDNKYIGTCLKIKATTENGAIIINLIDNCY